MEISCNVDLRNIKKDIFDEIVNFIKVNDAMLIYKNEIYDISKEELINLIISSDAYNFCKDPIGFLKNIESETIYNVRRKNNGAFSLL